MPWRRANAAACPFVGEATATTSASSGIAFAAPATQSAWKREPRMPILTFDMIPGTTRSPAPVHRAVQGGSHSVTVLLKPQVDGCQRAVRIRDAVDDEPAQERIAAPAVAGPVEATLRRVMEWIAKQVWIVARLELVEGIHRLEVSGPPSHGDG